LLLITKCSVGTGKEDLRFHILGIAVQNKQRAIFGFLGFSAGQEDLPRSNCEAGQFSARDRPSAEVRDRLHSSFPVARCIARSCSGLGRNGIDLQGA
jgi:hypothetical protein